jgi:NAD(P)-dependent dehydrogenase (short-subunit alcohol dehydrogenase family)
MTFPSDLTGRTAVVTGAGMGMGRTLALRLRREGCHLALCDVQLESLAEVAAECEAIPAPKGKELRVSIHQCDCGNRDSIKAFAVAVKEAHGESINLLFNNAGIQIQKGWDRMEEDEFDKVMSVNLDGVIVTTRAFWPMLVAADAAFVVNTSSIAGFMPPAGGISVPYVVSKYGVRGFSEHLMQQCKVIAPHVRVACVHPGAIATEIVGRNSNMKAGDLDPRFATRHMTQVESR